MAGIDLLYIPSTAEIAQATAAAKEQGPGPRYANLDPTITEENVDKKIGEMLHGPTFKSVGKRFD